MEEKNKGQQKKAGKTVSIEAEQQEQTEEETKEIVEELEEVAEEVEVIGGETAEVIEEVEKQNKLKKFIIGPNYKNLGQLRSSLVHSRNQIRKLTNLSGDVVSEETKALIESQSTILMQERERIKSVVTSEESDFSFLGWVFRFVNGYPKDSIDEQVEEDLEEEVLETETETEVETGTETETDTETETETEAGTDTWIETGIEPEIETKN